MTHGRLNLYPLNGGCWEGVTCWKERDHPLGCTPCGKVPSPPRDSVSLSSDPRGWGPSCPLEKGFVMCTVSVFPRVHLLLLLSIVLKRQTNPINYKKHKPEIQRNKECTIRAQSLPSPDCPRTPPEPGQLVEAGGGTISSLLCYKICAHKS